MEIKKEDVEKVALLARLALREDEKAEMVERLSEILTYMEQLNELDTDGVEPMAQILAEGIDHPTLREDTNRPSLERKDIVEAAPDNDGAYVKVPKVLDR